MDQDRPERTGAPAEERRWVTVLFADIAGFTAMSEQLDFEDVRDIADRCAEVMGDEVRRFGGIVLNVMGDAVMAVFGAPVAHEDDPERAVRAALAMVEAVPRKTPPEHNLALHVGVNTGEVMAGLLGPTARRDYTVMGDTTNTAARLEAAAVRGQVVVGRETYLATRHAIRYEEHEPVAAKGKTDLVESWLAVEPLAQRQERGAISAPLIGRDEEMSVLTGVWQRAVKDPRAYLMTVMAPPGLGKTRLAREFTAARTAEGALVLHGRSLPYGENTGFRPFADQVRSAAGVTVEMTPDEAAATLTAHVRDLFGSDQPDVVANLLTMMGLGGDEVPPDKNIFFYSVRRWLSALARRQPVLLVFEDIHWADEALLELVGSVASRAGAVPVMILCLARPELLDEHPMWGAGQAAYSAITLEPLDEAGARELSRALLGDRPPDVVERLATASGGNPLFVEELSATLSDQAALGSDELPTSVKAIIGARLDVLSEPERDLLLCAAVVGDVFWRSALGALDESDDVDYVLDELQARGLVRREDPSTLPGDEQYVFKHALIREVAYGRLPRRVRRERHGVVAAHLERVLGEQRDAMASLVAHHLDAAGEGARAANYYALAGDRASQAWAKKEAIELYTRALELADADDVVRVADLRARRARAFAGVGDAPSAVTDLEAALPHLAGIDRARALLDRARVAFINVDADGLIHYGELASEAAEAINDSHIEASAIAVKANAILMRGHLDEAIDTTAASVVAWPVDKQATDPDYADTLSNLALFQYWRGDYEVALESAQRAAECAVPVQALQAGAQGTAHLGMVLVGLGRHREAMECFERSVNLGLEWEVLPRYSGRSMNMWAGSVREMMDFERAREFSHRGLEMAKRAAFPPGIHSAEIDLFILDTIEGRFAEAESALPGLRVAARETKGVHNWLFEIRVAQAAAELALATGRPEQALEDATAAHARAGELPRKKYIAQSATVMATAQLALGRVPEAVTTAGTAVGLAEALRHPHTRWRAHDALSRALEAAGRDDEAAAEAARAAETARHFGAGLEVASAGVFFAAAEVEAVLERAAHAPHPTSPRGRGEE